MFPVLRHIIDRAPAQLETWPRRSVGKTIEILPWQALASGEADIG